MLLQRGLNNSALARGRLLHSQNDRRSTTNQQPTTARVSRRSSSSWRNHESDCALVGYIIVDAMLMTHWSWLHPTARRTTMGQQVNARSASDICNVAVSEAWDVEQVLLVSIGVSYLASSPGTRTMFWQFAIRLTSLFSMRYVWLYNISDSGRG
jgi:hypothetical protein